MTDTLDTTPNDDLVGDLPIEETNPESAIDEELVVNDTDSIDDTDVVLDEDEDLLLDTDGETSDTKDEVSENKYHATYGANNLPIHEDATEAPINRIPIARVTLAELDALIRNAKVAKDNNPKNPELQQQYSDLVEYARRLNTSDPFLHDAFINEETWVDRYAVEGKEAGSRLLKYRKANDNRALAGPMGIAYANSFIMRDRPIQIPCWHSGFYISISCPTAEDVIAMETQINLRRISYGRMTHGLIFSANSVYLEKAVIELAIDRLVGTTYPIDADIKTVLDERDHPLIAAYLLHVMYPHGAPFTDKCSNLADNCNYQRNITINFEEAVRVSYDALTPFMRKHMTQRTGLMKIEDIVRYREELNMRTGNTVDLMDKTIRVTFQPPTTQETFNAGEGWIQSIVQRTNSLFSTRLNNIEYNEYISRQTTAAELAGYGHWIKRIDLLNPDGSVDTHMVDKDTIIETLSRWSNTQELRDGIIDAVNRYIARSSIAFFGVPRFACPKCGNEKPNKDIYPAIVPLEIFDLFFTLAQVYTVRGIIG